MHPPASRLSPPRTSPNGKSLDRTTREVRLRTRTQMVLLATERCLTAAEIVSRP